jgi:Type II secretion system (T2SS), protein E, N-terminal domain
VTPSHRTEPLFASVAASSRALQAEAILDVLERRARPGERAEETLLDLGLVGDRDFALQLAFLSRLPYEGLRGFIPDPKLFLYVPVATAMVQRVCPLVLVDDSLKLASAYLDPDLLAVRTRFPNLDLSLVIAPRNELLEALRLVAPGF